MPPAPRAAAAAAAEWGQVVVLKGARTVIAAPDGETAVAPFVNPAIATGGTGDVLSGTIGSLLAQGLRPFDAACVGVHLHGLAGEAVRERLGDAGLLASDLPIEIAYRPSPPGRAGRPEPARPAARLRRPRRGRTTVLGPGPATDPAEEPGAAYRDGRDPRSVVGNPVLSEPIEAGLAAAGLPPLPRTAWLEIDLDRLAGNLAAIRRLPPRRRLASSPSSRPTRTATAPRWSPRGSSGPARRAVRGHARRGARPAGRRRPAADPRPLSDPAGGRRGGARPHACPSRSAT